MCYGSVARSQRGALTQAGAGIAASRRKLADFARPFVSSGEMKVLKLIPRVAVPLAIVALLGGCAARTSVAELKYNPGRYQDKTVSIEGVVTSSFSIPLVPFRFYRVDDGTGEVTVIAENERVPTKGARVRVRGRVNEVATFGGQSVGLHIRQTDLDFR